MQLQPRTFANDRNPLLMWWGLVIYMAGFCVPGFITGPVGLLLIMGGTLTTYFGIFGAKKQSLSELCHVGKVLGILLLLWHAYMFVRSPWDDLTNLILYLDPYTFSCYLYPLLLLLPIGVMVSTYFRVATPLLYASPFMVIAMMFTYYDNGGKQFFFEGFLLASAFVLLTYRYHSRRIVTWAIVALVVGLLIATLTARRNLMMTCALYMLGAGVIWFFRDGKTSNQNRFFIVLSAVIVVILVAAAFMLESNGAFRLISERAGENTRDYVFLFYFTDLLQTPLDIVFGRGIRGAYECGGVDDTSGYDTTRQCIENGFLQLMLKGGICYLVLYLTTFFYAIRRGLKSTNQVCIAAAIVLLVQVLDMFPFGLHAMNIKAFMIWMCVAILLHKDLWKKSDKEIEDLFFESQQRLPHWASPQSSGHTDNEDNNNTVTPC